MTYYLEPVEDGSEKIVRRDLPTGTAWLAAITPGKYFYRLISALAKPFDDAWQLFYKTISDELSPYRTNELMPEWEKGLSLPDKCIGPQTDIEARREMVLFRLRRKRWTTIANWYELVALFGVQATFTPGTILTEDIGYGDYDYPIIYGGFQAGGMYRVYIELHNCGEEGYDYAYPVIYPTQSEACRRFKCILERIRPGCVVFIWGSPPEKPEDVIDDTWDIDTITLDETEVL